MHTQVWVILAYMVLLECDGLSIDELSQGLADCSAQVKEPSCHSIKTDSSQMSAGRTLSEFADTAGIFSDELENACAWNPIAQTCMFRCNHEYQFLPSTVASRMEDIREQAHYVYQEFGAGCTAFNVRPETNGNYACHVCEDPDFNPPECYNACAPPCAPAQRPRSASARPAPGCADASRARMRAGNGEERRLHDQVQYAAQLQLRVPHGDHRHGRCGGRGALGRGRVH
jgi:hypothetical protein